MILNWSVHYACFFAGFLNLSSFTVGGLLPDRKAIGQEADVKEKHESTSPKTKQATSVFINGSAGAGSKTILSSIYLLR